MGIGTHTQYWWKQAQSNVCVMSLFVRDKYINENIDYFQKDTEETGNHGCFCRGKLEAEMAGNVTFTVCFLYHVHALSISQFLKIEMHKDVHCCIVYTRQNKSTTPGMT